MVYLKLCQILLQGNPGADGKPREVYYQEDEKGKILVNNLSSFPATFECEVISWVSEAEYKKHGKVDSFVSVNVTLNPVASIREAIYDRLVVTYPTLVI